MSVEMKSERAKEQDKMRKDLLLGDVHDCGLGNSIQSFIDHELGKHPELPERFVEILRATPDRLLWLHERLRAFEDGLGMADLPSSQVESHLRVLKEHGELLESCLPHVHPEFGVEPLPYHVVDARRFVNMAWVEWYMQVNPAGPHGGKSKDAVIWEAGSRTARMLFPTPESIKPLAWWVNDTPHPKERDGEMFYPYEIVINRRCSQRV